MVAGYRIRGVALTLLLLATLVAAPAAAQILVEPMERKVVVRPGEATPSNHTLANPTERSYFVLAAVSGELAEETHVEPTRFLLGPEGTVQVNLTITVPSDTAFEAGDLVLQLTIIDRVTGEVFEKEAVLHVTLERPDRFLGLFEGVLPPPFESGWGMFWAEILAWAVLSFLVASLVGLVVGFIARRGTEATKDKITAKLRVPLWYLIFVLGLNFSWRLVPKNPVIEVLDRLNNVVALFVAGVLLYRAISGGLIYYSENIAVRTRTRMDDLLVPVLEKVGLAVVVAIVTLFSLRILGIDLSFLLAGGLVVGLVVSFAAQDTLSNFFSGIFILIDRPFREGDELLLETGDMCRVDRIGLRSTRMFHFKHNQEMIVPNNELATKRVVNMSYPDAVYRMSLDVSVAYDTDLRKAIEVVMRAAREHPKVLSGLSREPAVFVKDFGDSGIDLELRVYVPSTRERNPVGTDLRVAIKEAFDREGITIPFPQRDVWMRGGGDEGKADGPEPLPA